jgi:hypothetical protein
VVRQSRTTGTWHQLDQGGGGPEAPGISLTGVEEDRGDGHRLDRPRAHAHRYVGRERWPGEGGAWTGEGSAWAGEGGGWRAAAGAGRRRKKLDLAGRRGHAFWLGPYTSVGQSQPTKVITVTSIGLPPADGSYGNFYWLDLTDGSYLFSVSFLRS